MDDEVLNEFEESTDLPTESLLVTREDQFRQMKWTWGQCLVGLVGVIGIWLYYLISAYRGYGERVSVDYFISYCFLFFWMVFYPILIMQKQQDLRSPVLKKVLKEFAVSIPLVIGTFFILFIFAILIQAISGEPVVVDETIYRFYGARPSFSIILFLLFVFTVGPLAEEIFFRGLFYNTLRRRMPVIAAMGVQAMVFMVIHYGTTYQSGISLVAVFLIGFLLALIYEWRKTIWAPIFVHGLNNFGNRSGPMA